MAVVTGHAALEGIANPSRRWIGRCGCVSSRIATALVAATLALPAASALASGTPACTQITNSATATYNIGGTVFVQESNVAITTVAHLIDANVIWQDAAAVVVAPGDADRMLTFLVTNTGNAEDTFSLGGLSALAGDDFDPLLVDIYLDVDGDGLCDLSSDDRYLAGTNDPVLAPDGSIIVFVLNDIPLALPDGSLGYSELTATSNTGSGPAGTIVPGGASCDADAVVGSSGGLAADTGTYIVSNAVLSIIKSASIDDPFGGSEPVPGATIGYTIVVSVSGTGTAEDVVITDPIPMNTTYSAGTLALNAGALTDAVDADDGDVGGTTPGVVTVSVGDIDAWSAVATITFDVVID